MFSFTSDNHLTSATPRSDEPSKLSDPYGSSSCPMKLRVLMCPSNPHRSLMQVNSYGYSKSYDNSLMEFSEADPT
jgi:hypothetical protein